MTPSQLPRAFVGAAAMVAAFAVFGASGAAAQNRRTMPPIRHVFVLLLENTNFDTTFREGSDAPYLADTLRKRGALLREYYGTGHFSLDNYIAMVSGVAPTRETQLDCPRYLDFVDTGSTRKGQPAGKGCVYPVSVTTVANQLEAKGLTWKAYMEDMGATPAREASACAHPVLGALDSTQRATADDNYATKHNPFMYFHSVIDTPGCRDNVLPLPRLEEALRSASTTPNFSFISPGLCHDGHDRPCRNGEPGGLVSADAFLQRWVPIITSSPAFRADGLLIITFDEAMSIDARACCHEPSGPNVANPGVNGPGGGRIGAVLISRYIRPRTVSMVGYNHYSMLRSVEDIFGLPYLGYAGAKGLSAFGSDVFTQPRGK